jgi:hypothetical protein
MKGRKTVPQSYQRGWKEYWHKGKCATSFIYAILRCHDNNKNNAQVIELSSKRTSGKNKEEEIHLVLLFSLSCAKMVHFSL